MSAVKEVLRSSVMLSSLGEDDISLLEKMGKTERCSEFDIVLKEGAVNHFLYIIIWGSVSVVQENTHLGVLEKGQHFGEMSLLDGQLIAASVVANTDTTVWMISHTHIMDFISRPDSNGERVLMALSKQLCQRLRNTDTALREANKRNIIDENQLNSFLSELNSS